MFNLQRFIYNVAKYIHERLTNKQSDIKLKQLNLHYDKMIIVVMWSNLSRIQHNYLVIYIDLSFLWLQAFVNR